MQNSLYKAEESRDVELLGAFTDRRVAAFRLILAAVALIVIHLDPADEHFFRLTRYALVAYTMYSLLIYVVARRRINLSDKLFRALTWADVACYSLLVLSSRGAIGLFFFFYLFAIVIASSRGGTQLGLSVTFVSTVLCIIANTESSRNQILRPAAILALGSILAYWGGAELVL